MWGLTLTQGLEYFIDATTDMSKVQAVYCLSFPNFLNMVYSMKDVRLLSGRFGGISLFSSWTILHYNCFAIRLFLFFSKEIWGYCCCSCIIQNEKVLVREDCGKQSTSYRTDAVCEQLKLQDYLNFKYSYSPIQSVAGHTSRCPLQPSWTASYENWWTSLFQFQRKVSQLGPLFYWPLDICGHSWTNMVWACRHLEMVLKTFGKMRDFTQQPLISPPLSLSSYVCLTSITMSKKGELAPLCVTCLQQLSVAS